MRLWDISDPAAPRQVGDPLEGHTDGVTAVAFGPDGLLASAGDDGTVLLWDVGVLEWLRDSAVEVACPRAGRGLDEREWSRYLPDEPYRNTCPGQPTL